MLEVRRLSKTFRVPKGPRAASGPVDPRQRAGLFHAVRSVSFAAPTGAVLGVLGPNGAGKTTLMRLLSTALRPSAGTATVDGFDVVRQPRQVRRRLGFLSGNTGLYGRLTASEMVRYYGELHRVDPKVLAVRVRDLLGQLDLADAADRRCDVLSAGMKQKVSIARTLIHDPEVVVLDEPTTGLDVAAARSIHDFVVRLRDRGKTVVLSTHHMHEVDALCDRVVVLKQGRVCLDGTVEDLRQRGGDDRLDQALLNLLDAPEVDHAA